MVFSVSLLLLALSSLRLSSRLSSSPADGYWIFIATAMLQLGVIAGLTSSIHQLHPAAWIVAQLLICAIVLLFCGGLQAPTAQRVFGWWRQLLSSLGTFVTETSPVACNWAVTTPTGVSIRCAPA